MKDTHLRSFIKGITWRITGTVDTIFLAFIITGHFGNAVKIGLAEVVTKIIIYYLHERSWNFIKWGRVSQAPAHIRSFVKGITWRIIGTIDTIMLAFLITGHVENALKIGGFEMVTKVVLYYCHERVWALLKWGRIRVEEETAEIVEQPKTVSEQIFLLDMPVK